MLTEKIMSHRRAAPNPLYENSKRIEIFDDMGYSICPLMNIEIFALKAQVFFFRKQSFSHTTYLTVGMNLS